MEAEDRHDRFDALAVGHVLGGLDDAAAASFRGHLIGCDPCRRRVAELRGIAADLAAAEREERSRIPTKTVVRRTESAGEQQPGARPLGTLAIAAVGLTVLVGLLFWIFHLREVNATLTDVAQVRESVLAGMAAGEAVPLRVTDAVEGQVVVDQRGQLVGSLANLPITGTGQRVVAWLLGPDTGGAGGQVLSRVAVDVTPDGLGAFRLSRSDGARFVLSVEQIPIGAAPSGRELATAELR